MNDVLFIYISSMYRHAKNGTILTGEDFQRMHINRLRDGRVDASCIDPKMFDVCAVYIKNEAGWIPIKPHNVKVPKYFYDDKVAIMDEEIENVWRNR